MQKPPNERAGAMVLRTLSSSRKYYRLSLLAKAALPLLLAWSDDQGRIELDVEDIKMRPLLALHECGPEDVSRLFEEYASVGFGVLYEFSLGKRALQWTGWHDAQTMRTKKPSRIPAPPEWEDQVRSVKEETWYQQREHVRQLEREAGVVGSKGGNGGAPPRPEYHPEDEIQMLRGTYTAEQLKWIDEAVSAIRTVKPPTEMELLAEYRMWDRQPKAAVAGAAQTFVVKLHHKDGRGFEYLRGIIKRWEEGEQAPRPKPGKEEKRTALVTLLINASYDAPKPTDEQGLKKFKGKLLDIIIAERLTRASALHLVRDLKVQEWYGVDAAEIERRVNAAIKGVPKEVLA